MRWKGFRLKRNLHCTTLLLTFFLCFQLEEDMLVVLFRNNRPVCWLIVSDPLLSGAVSLHRRWEIRPRTRFSPRSMTRTCRSLGIKRTIHFMLLSQSDAIPVVFSIKTEQERFWFMDTTDHFMCTSFYIFPDWTGFQYMTVRNLP